jgi:Zn-dependent protease
MSLLITMFAAMLMGIPAMFFHECGHIAVALFCGVKIKKVGLSWMGLYTVREAGPRWANLWVSFAGPAVNLVLAFALRNTLPGFAWVNLVAALFNLMPIPNSDGSRILGLLVSSKTAAAGIAGAQILGSELLTRPPLDLAYPPNAMKT